MNIADLMLLSEASGFSGGSADFVDEYPELSLDECMASLPIIIMESQIEGFEISRAHNDALVEAVASQIRSGVMDESAMGELSEKGFDSIKSAVTSFFARIKKIIEAIIAKLKVFIDKLRMTGKQLWSKYGNDPDLKKTEKLKDLTFDGYKFASEVFDTSKFDNAEGPENLIKGAYNGDDTIAPDKVAAKFEELRRYISVKEEDAEGNVVKEEHRTSAIGANVRPKGNDEHMEEVNKVIETLGDQTSKDRSSKMAAELTGMSDLGEDWKEAVRKKLWGEKVTLTYGKDGFDLSSVGSILSNPTNLDKIRTEYENLRKGVEAYEKKLTGKLDKVNARADKTKNAGLGKVLAAESSYYTKYMEAIKDAYGVITGVKNIRTDFEKAKADQAKAMFGRMISAAKKGSVAAAAKKPDNNDAEVDDELLFELD